MANAPLPPQQGGASTPSQQPQQGSGSTPQHGSTPQPSARTIRDWASI